MIQKTPYRKWHVNTRALQQLEKLRHKLRSSHGRWWRKDGGGRKGGGGRAWDSLPRSHCTKKLWALGTPKQRALLAPPTTPLQGCTQMPFWVLPSPLLSVALCRSLETHKSVYAFLLNTGLNSIRIMLYLCITKHHTKLHGVPQVPRVLFPPTSDKIGHIGPSERTIPVCVDISGCTLELETYYALFMHYKAPYQVTRGSPSATYFISADVWQDSPCHSLNAHKTSVCGYFLAARLNSRRIMLYLCITRVLGQGRK